jgi:enoyl-CoA hydratase/carnithine racemase
LADTKRLVDAVGPSAAKNILYTGEIVGADTALRIGLINDLHAPHALEAAVVSKVEQIACASQWTVRKAKEVISLILSGTVTDTVETNTWQLDAVEGPDFAEGRAAFMAKRTPLFPYR